ncbi:hypothetical protein HDE_13427 [Halotydeus destructor]|nr:hypothetical protein HDE_13427 [Halotydeus destructor]
MKLQPDIVEGGQKVLTCFLLPQQGPLGEDYSHSDSAGHYEHSPDHAGVKFSGMSDTVSGGPVRSEGLLRNPTPYPKELKAHAKHAKNLAFKNRATGEPDIVGDNQARSRRKGMSSQIAFPSRGLRLPRPRLSLDLKHRHHKFIQSTAL